MGDVYRLNPEEEAAWRAWVRDLGVLVRRMRELLDMSQEHLGRLAKVSQGAVSRFEAGRGLSTPWIIAVRLRVALAARLRALDPTLLTDDARRFLAQTDLYGLPAEVSRPPRVDDVSIAPSSGLETALRLYHRLPEEGRALFEAVMTGVATALTHSAHSESASDAEGPKERASLHQ
jgi:transcriptional regulator with XRE-family HTH domain